MVEKAKIFYFSVFILAVFAFIFHVTAMGHHHWKKADARNTTFVPMHISIGLFKRCEYSPDTTMETCYPNTFPSNLSCNFLYSCSNTSQTNSCPCDYLPSTKGIAACAIIASIFLGLAIIILFAHSINTSETRAVGLILGLFPLILLVLAVVFILITLILIGSYLSRDIMYMVHAASEDINLDVLRTRAQGEYQVRVDWSTGLEIISLFLTFVSLILYSAFVFKFGRGT